MISEHAPFVDHRFDVRIRPEAEYRIPELGQRVLSVVFEDDGDVARTWGALSAHTRGDGGGGGDGGAKNSSTRRHGHGDGQGVRGEAARAHVETLRREGDRVRKLMRVHLCRVADAWCAHVRRLVSSFETQLQHLHDECKDAHRNAGQIRSRIQRVTNEHRASSPPEIARPRDLEEAITALRAAYAAAKERMGESRRVAVHLREDFDASLARMQQAVLRAFATEMLTLLGSPPSPPLPPPSPPLPPSPP